MANFSMGPDVKRVQRGDIMALPRRRCNLTSLLSFQIDYLCGDQRICHRGTLYEINL